MQRSPAFDPARTQRPFKFDVEQQLFISATPYSNTVWGNLYDVMTPCQVGDIRVTFQIVSRDSAPGITVVGQINERMEIVPYAGALGTSIGVIHIGHVPLRALLNDDAHDKLHGMWLYILYAYFFWFSVCFLLSFFKQSYQVHF